MTAEQFAYWLQGYAELNETPPTAEQWQSIREHLATVFIKVTPPAALPAQIAGWTWDTAAPAKDERPMVARCSRQPQVVKLC